jgi:hypothetical protein
MDKSAVFLVALSQVTQIDEFVQVKQKYGHLTQA